MTKAKTFSAFVSYRHRPADEKWALWVQETLETFQTPAELIAQGIAPGCGTVFVDDTEMAAASELPRELKTALYGADWLIVIASTATPHSEWVRREINLFQNAWGRGDRVLTLLIEGTPETSFPPELRRLITTGEGIDTVTELIDPAGASVVETQDKTEAELKALARDKLAAALLGCDLGMLRDRQAARLRRETTVKYYDFMLRQHGVPTGFVELTEQMVAHRFHSYRFEYRDGRVQVIKRINCKGNPTEDDKGVYRWDMSWRDDGTIEAIAHRTQNDDTRLREVFSRDGKIIDFYHDDHAAAAKAGFGGGFGDPGIGSEAAKTLGTRHTRIMRHLITYDDAGFVAEQRYCSDTFNTPAADALGTYGELTKNRPDGRPLNRHYIDGEGNPMALRNGVAGMLFTYQGDLLAEVILQDLDGQPIRSADGYSRKRLEHDTWLNLTAECFLDEEGRPCFHRGGYAIKRQGLADDMTKGWTEFCDGDGTLVENAEGVARICYDFDSNGYSCRDAHFEKDGTPATLVSGISGAIGQRDRRGNNILIKVFDANESPTLTVFGMCEVRFKRDQRGNIITREWFDTEGKPGVTQSGISSEEMEYDAAGRVISGRFKNAEGNLTINNKGYAALTYSYDPRGNLKEQRYFDPDGNPTRSSENFCTVINRHDDGGNLISQAYLDENGAPLMTNKGYARCETDYDSLGNAVEERYFDPDGKPTLNKTGWARAVVRHSDQGRAVTLSFFGAKDEPLVNANSWHTERQRRNARGLLVDVNGHDTSGRPCLRRANGAAGWRMSYDRNGNRSRTEFYGLNGETTENKEGIARISSTYDRKGRLLTQVSTDAEGNKVAGEQGYAESQGAYDDTLGHRTVVYFDADATPAKHPDGYYGFVEVKDARGRVTEITYLGPDGTPQAPKDTAARFTYDYDERGNQIAYYYFDADGNATRNDGYASAKARFNDRNQQVGAEYYDEFGHLTLCADGYARFESTYDERGLRQTSRAFGSDGKPVLTPKKGHLIQREWDRFSRRVAGQYFGLNDEPINCASGYHRVDFIRDRFGKCTAMRFSDVDGVEIPAPEDHDEKPDD
jgi:hypothetical protein